MMVINNIVLGTTVKEKDLGITISADMNFSIPYRKKHIDTLERIQRKATKIIPELRYLSYEKRLKEYG